MRQTYLHIKFNLYMNANKIYYSITEVAELLQVNPSLLRYWETEFSLLNPRKDPKGNRMYTQKDINIVKTIYYLVKTNGFTLEGAKKQLTENKQQLKTNLEIIEKLQSVKSKIKQLINKL